MFALREGQNVVVEYSELDPEEACALDSGCHHPLPFGIVCQFLMHQLQDPASLMAPHINVNNLTCRHVISMLTLPPKAA